MLAFFTNEPEGPTINVGIAPAGGPNALAILPAGVVPLKAIADTGAMVTCITAAVAAQAGLQPIGKAQVQSANNVSAVNQYFGDLWIGGRNVGGTQFFWPFRNRTFLELLMPGSGYQALLGMDIFREGMLIVDGPTNRTTFAW